MQNKSLVNVIRYLVYASALIPLVIWSQFLSPFHFGKVLVFRSLIEVMFVFYVILILRDKSYLPRPNKIFYSFLAFTLAYSVTTITSSQVFQSIWGTLERMGGLWTFWHYFIFFVIATSILRSREDWFNLFRLMIVAGLLSAFYGFLQKTDASWIVGGGGRTRIFGTIGNAALFAGYQILIYFLALIMFLRKGENEKWKIFYAITALLAGLAALMTAVRGSLLGIVLGTLLFAFLYFWQNKTNTSRRIFYGVAAFIILFVLFAFSFKNSDFVRNSSYLNRVTNFSLKNQTVQTRFWAWQAGFKGWSEGPRRMILGWGPENFNIPFSIYFNPKFYMGPGSETLFDRAHNMFVEVLVTMGLVGFLAYLSIFGSIFVGLKKKLKEDPEDSLFAMGFMAMTMAYMIHNAFIFDTSANFITFFSILGFISYISFSSDKISPERSGAILPKGLINFIGIILGIFVAVLIYKTNVLPAYANYATTRAIVAGWNKDYTGAIKKFEEAVGYDVAGKYEFRNRMAQYILEVGAASSKFPNYLDVIKNVIVEMKKNEADYPIDYLPKLYLSRLNIMLGKDDPKSPYNDEALKESLSALTLSKTFVRTYYEVAQGYLNKKDYKSARDYFQQAADLNPNVGLSYFYLGSVELMLGNTARGAELIELATKKGTNIEENDYRKLVDIYITLKDNTKLVWAFENLTRLAPNNAQYFASLAVAYARVDRIDDAVKAARQAAKIDPKFAPESARFIKELGR